MLITYFNSCYVVIIYNGSKKATKRIENECSPIWDQSATFKLDNKKKTIKIRVYVSKMLFFTQYNNYRSL